MRADFSLDYDVLTVEQSQKLYLAARFEAGESPNDQLRRPLNLSLVIDRSGSMAGDKIDYTKEAAQFLVQHLGNTDMFSVVLYNDQVETLVPPATITRKDALTQLIDKIRVRGTTNLSGGWLEGCQHVAAHLDQARLNRVILMSDGLANRGITDRQSLVKMAQQKRDEGVTTTTMGLGNDFNEDLLMEMANAGGGAFYFIESPEVTPAIFHEELAGLLNVVGQNLVITIFPNEHVANIHQLNAYPVHTDGSGTAFRLGDIFGSEVKQLVLELSIPALAKLGEQEIATLRFEYDETVGGSVQHQVKEVAVVVNIQPEGTPLPQPNPDVSQSVLLLRAAQARQNAVKAADQGDYDTASRMLREVADAIDVADLADESLQEERDALQKQAQQLEKGTQSYTGYDRKTMSTQAFYTMTNRHDDTVMLRFRESQRATYPEGMAAATPADRAEAADPAVPRQPGVTPTHVTWNGKTFALDQDILRLGRASHNEIVLDARGVSRFHSQIKRREGALFIEDLGSTNGTTIDGQRITQAHPLSVGDVIFLCDEKLVFHGGDTRPDSDEKTVPGSDS